MLTISSRGWYGLAAMLELATHYQKGPIQIKDIAEAQELPQHYLEQLLGKLRQSGLLKSFRGARGGYCLAKSPLTIKVLDILICLDGDIALGSENHTSSPIIRYFFQCIHQQIAALLDKTLYDLVLDGQRLEQNFTYTI